ncbi:MAG: hypothetical protein PHQ47_00020 [Candidatus Portnoybacteria bacterium]|nr:hypothetical protein [Candidatus Portnoybacteria bacterium]
MKKFELKIFFKKAISGWLILTTLILCFAGMALPEKKAEAALATEATQAAQMLQDGVFYFSDVASTVEDEVVQGGQLSFQGIMSAIDGWFKWDTLMERALRLAWYKMKRQILRDLANAILNWAKGEDGTPAFVTDWKGYLSNLGKNAVTKLINDQINSIAMCFNFSLSLKAWINWQDINLNDQLACPMTPFVLQNFLSDFQRGGWDSWKSFISPSGNMYGSFMIVSDEILKEEERERQAQTSKLIANQGYKGNATTPGILQAHAVNEAAMMEWTYLMNSQEFEEFVFALADAFIIRIIRGGVSALQTNDYDYSSGQPVSVTPQTNTYINASSEKETIDEMKNRLALLTEALQGLLNEQNQNLSLMQSIKTIQNTLASRDCALASLPIDNELNALTNQINQTQTRISQAQQAALDNDALINAIASIESAQDSGDQAALESASTVYQTTREKAVQSFSALLGSTQRDLNTTFSEMNSYLLAVNRQANTYSSNRGMASIGTGLEGRRAAENQLLLACPEPIATTTPSILF